MRVLRSVLGFAAFALVLGGQSALARDLDIATVTPQGVSCVFTPSCAVSVTDTLGYFSLFGNGGHAQLLVRTYPGLPGTQAAGLTGYSFYVDMRAAVSLGSSNCVEKLVLDTGPLAPLKYSGGKSSDMFVVGAPAGAGIASASQNGNKLVIRFAKSICPGPKGESLYFGFAAKTGPMPGKAEITGTHNDTVKVDARVPKH
jgi:hypothetical protein